jgi:hypothetical protein
MTQSQEYKEKCQLYRDKCRQHLYRASLARSLALSQIRTGGAAALDNQKLVLESLGDAYRNQPADLDAVITKTNFLVLKIEFEFFLKRMTYCLWDYHFEMLIRQGKVRGLSGKHTLKEFAGAIATGRGKEFILHRLIPQHGLERFERALKDSTGISLPGLFSGKDQFLWCQIRSAFQLRHLIEHANGKVDEAYKSKVVCEKDWQKSSWGQLPLNVGDKIPIREDDFEATFATMDQAAQVIAGRLETFPP